MKITLTNPHTNYFTQMYYKYKADIIERRFNPFRLLSQFVFYRQGLIDSLNYNIRSITIEEIKTDDIYKTDNFKWVYKAFDNTHSFCWQPDITEYHNLHGNMVMVGHMMLMGWYLHAEFMEDEYNANMSFIEKMINEEERVTYSIIPNNKSNENLSEESTISNDTENLPEQ